jgi:hypothetical protein
MKWFCFLAEVPYGGELYISIDYGFKDFLESNGGGAPRSRASRVFRIIIPECPEKIGGKKCKLYALNAAKASIILYYSLQGFLIQSCAPLSPELAASLMQREKGPEKRNLH